MIGADENWFSSPKIIVLDLAKKSCRQIALFGPIR